MNATRNLFFLVALGALSSGCKSDYMSVNRQSRGFLSDSFKVFTKTRKASLKNVFNRDRAAENRQIRYEGRGFLYESFSTPGWKQSWKNAGSFFGDNVRTDRYIRKADNLTFGFKDTDVDG